MEEEIEELGQQTTILESDMELIYDSFTRRSFGSHSDLQ
jgi:hypothetical protein